MWVRQCELDANAEALLPIPPQIASNEEFIPPPQSPEQAEYEARAAPSATTPRAAKDSAAAIFFAPAAAWPPRCWR